MPVSGPGIASVGAGSVLLWSAIYNQKITVTLQSIVQGKKPAEGPKPVDTVTPSPADVASSLGVSPGTGVNLTGSAAKNQAIARLLAAPYGWSSGPNWDALVSLWNSESGWSNTIWNTSASCGNGAYAYGVVQACGHGAQIQTSHSAIGPYPIGNPGNPPEYGGVSSAAGQIAWGLAYIKANYGEPVNVPHGGY